jgi:hypothetical protein
MDEHVRFGERHLKEAQRLKHTFPASTP